MLTYSTPIFATPVVIRKPRVNFHSIDDIVYGGHSTSCTGNDSGLGVSNNTTKSPVLSNYSSPEIQDNKENCATSSAPNSDKKVRTTFTDHQKKMLDVYFRKNPYPDPSETEDLSQQLVLPENVIKVWFQNKRSRDKQRQFSHAYKSKKNQQHAYPQETAKPASFAGLYDSPLVANLKNMSKFNTYTAAAAIAAFAHAAQNGQHYYNNNHSTFYSN